MRFRSVEAVRRGKTVRLSLKERVRKGCAYTSRAIRARLRKSRVEIAKPLGNRKAGWREPTTRGLKQLAKHLLAAKMQACDELNCNHRQRCYPTRRRSRNCLEFRPKVREFVVFRLLVVLEPRDAATPCEPDVARGAVALLADEQIGLPCHGLPLLVVLSVHFFAVNEHHDVGILLDSTRFA